jgi:GrpB-like predicted nucleotidyltransferase (UPF0157 family)
MNTTKRVEVLPYNTDWPIWFEEISSPIEEALKGAGATIEHVGSTSVPGLAAKPRIDIDIVIPNSNSLESCITKLSKFGYHHRGNLGVPGREAFRCENPKYPHNLYLCVAGCEALKNHLTLRDHLRENPEDAKAYSTLKLQLAEKFRYDIDSYCEGKTDFIVSILSKHGFSDSSLASIQDINRK